MDRAFGDEEEAINVVCRPQSEVDDIIHYLCVGELGNWRKNSFH